MVLGLDASKRSDWSDQCCVESPSYRQEMSCRGLLAIRMEVGAQFPHTDTPLGPSIIASEPPQAIQQLRASPAERASGRRVVWRVVSGRGERKPREEGGLAAIASHRCLVIEGRGLKPMHTRDLTFCCGLTSNVCEHTVRVLGLVLIRILNRFARTCERMRFLANSVQSFEACVMEWANGCHRDHGLLGQIRRNAGPRPNRRRRGRERGRCVYQ